MGIQDLGKGVARNRSSHFAVSLTWTEEQTKPKNTRTQRLSTHEQLQHFLSGSHSARFAYRRGCRMNTNLLWNVSQAHQGATDRKSEYERSVSNK